MVRKSKIIVKGVGKITFVEMTIPVVFKLPETRNLAGYIPKRSKLKNKLN